MNATTIVAIAGILGTLFGSFGGHILQARLKERSDRLAKLRETRVALYFEATEYAVREEAWLDWLQTPFRLTKVTLPDAARAELITGKLELFAPADVLNEWRHLLKTSQRLSDYFEEEGAHYYRPDEEGRYVAEPVPDIPRLLAVRNAISLLRKTMRAALGTPDD